MADKSSQLVLDALSRAAAEPIGLPLHGGRTLAGLFPTTSLGKQTAQRCLKDGFLRAADAGVRNKLKSPSELYVITDKGLGLLLQQANPRQVLEDLLRILEKRQEQANELLHLAGQVRADLTHLKIATERVLQQVPRTEALTATFSPAAANGAGLPERRFEEGGGPRGGPTADQVAALHRAILTNLDRWRGAGASEDYPLAELFRHLQRGIPGLTIGRFHDALRDLHDADRLYLHPWTGPLYDLPEPAFALLVGHLVAYYASSRPHAAVAMEQTGTATVLPFPVK